MANDDLTRLREIRDALRAAPKVRRARDQLIRRAAKEGYPLHQIAKAAGVSPGRASRIVSKR